MHLVEAAISTGWCWYWYWYWVGLAHIHKFNTIILVLILLILFNRFLCLKKCFFSLFFLSWKWDFRKSLELDRCFVFITVSVDCSTVDLINITRIYTQIHTLSHLNNGKDDNGQTALLRSCNIVRRSCNQHTQKIPTNPIETELKLMIKKDRCKRSFLLNFIRTQMNQLVSVKQMRSSLYVREHLAFTFSSNASRRSLAIYDLW